MYTCEYYFIIIFVFFIKILINLSRTFHFSHVQLRCVRYFAGGFAATRPTPATALPPPSPAFSTLGGWTTPGDHLRAAPSLPSSPPAPTGCRHVHGVDGCASAGRRTVGVRQSVLLVSCCTALTGFRGLAVVGRVFRVVLVIVTDPIDRPSPRSARRRPSPAPPHPPSTPASAPRRRPSLSSATSTLGSSSTAS